MNSKEFMTKFIEAKPKCIYQENHVRVLEETSIAKNVIVSHIFCPLTWMAFKETNKIYQLMAFREAAHKLGMTGDEALKIQCAADNYQMDYVRGSKTLRKQLLKLCGRRRPVHPS